MSRPAQWFTALILLAAFQAAAAQSCTLDQVQVLGGREPGEAMLQLRGNCASDEAPQFGYLRKQGDSTRLVFSSAGQAGGGEIPWLLRVPLGMLPAGPQAVEVYFPDAQGDDNLMTTFNFDVPSVGCGEARRPGATLLYPYFEVNLDDPTALTTLVSINNASSQPILARATLWSDWGFPVLAFDLYLIGDDILSLNLRDILLHGNLPQTGAELVTAAYPGCAAPLALPDLDPAALASLRARLSGAPDPQTGLCSSSDRGTSSTLVGFLTVDTVERCADADLYPNHQDYFGASGDRVAGDLNALWGDLILVSSGANSAAGFEAISVLADPAFDSFNNGRFTRLPSFAFYPFIESHRPPLANRHRTRFLKGGSFAGDSQLLVWLGQFNPGAGVTCGESGIDLEIFPSLNLAVSGEDGGLPPATFLPLSAFVFNLAIDDPRLGELPASGFLQLSAHYVQPVPILPPVEALQGVILTRLEAEGRFSVGYAATSSGFLPLCSSN